MLTIEGGVLELTMFCIAINPPKVIRVLPQAATTMAALGAAALAHSASRIASPSSPATIPGAEQLLSPLAGVGCTVVRDPPLYWFSPNVLRKVSQSAELYRSVSSITAMVCPTPVIPCANRGFRS